MFFSRLLNKSKVKCEEQDYSEFEINFSDSSGIPLALFSKKSGNENLLILDNRKTESEITLDRDKAKLLASILYEYSSQGNIERCIKTLKEGK